MRTPNQHLAFGTGAHYCLVRQPPVATWPGRSPG
jgi:hypothetical protein